VLAEDTRVSRKLLSHLGVSRPLESLHAHSTDDKVTALADRLGAGATMALVTDAGAPGVSDPGDALVTAAVARGVVVVPIPGPSAVTTALMASGLGGHGHRFVGFLPRTPGRRRRALEALRAETGAIVAFEAPDRLAPLLAAAAEVLGSGRRGVVCRELTKRHEQIVHGTLGELCGADIPARGEMTLVIAGAGPEHAEAVPDDDVQERLRNLLVDGQSVRDATDLVAAESGRARRDVYRIALRIAPEVTRRREPR